MRRLEQLSKMRCDSRENSFACPPPVLFTTSLADAESQRDEGKYCEKFTDSIGFTTNGANPQRPSFKQAGFQNGLVNDTAKHVEVHLSIEIG